MLSLSCVNHCPEAGVFIQESSSVNNAAVLRITPTVNEQNLQLADLMDRIHAFLHILFLLDSRPSTAFGHTWMWDIHVKAGMPELLLQTDEALQPRIASIMIENQNLVSFAA